MTESNYSIESIEQRICQLERLHKVELERLALDDRVAANEAAAKEKALQQRIAAEDERGKLFDEFVEEWLFVEPGGLARVDLVWGAYVRWLKSKSMTRKDTRALEHEEFDKALMSRCDARISDTGSESIRMGSSLGAPLPTWTGIRLKLTAGETRSAAAVREARMVGAVRG